MNPPTGGELHVAANAHDAVKAATACDLTLS
jgi:hypothetical protein